MDFEDLFLQANTNLDDGVKRFASETLVRTLDYLS